ncbi:hypothetical protein [Burkholderia pseudomultivorans]|uniref:hypothetical protein n=1 Tax=Burkholderia pseudomultivorans TaxID=1207504 RepID=UPI000ABE3AA4|nr:hypothetical protein [Burkholderia pseudomultivorans]
MTTLHTNENLQSELSRLIGDGLRADVGRLENDEPFEEVIPNFDSLAMLEIILLLEEKEGFELDKHFDSANPVEDPAAAYKAFPANIGALAQALIKARQAEALNKETKKLDPN